jgi:phage tail sheath gpL-like
MAVLAQFPTTTKMPVVGVSVILGTGGTAGQAVPKVLMLGVGLAAGSKSAGDIDSVQSGSEADAFYGAGSSLARMCRRAIEEQKGAQVYGGFVADAGGTAAQATITFAAGPSVVASTYEITIAGWTVTVSIPAATTAAAAGPLLDAAIKAHEFYDQMPITSAVAGAIVTLTTKEANAETTTQVTNIWQNADNLDVLTATLNTGATAGVGALSLTTILAAAATTRYNYIVTRCSDSTNLALLETHLDTYAAPLQGKRQQGIAGSMDTPANQITLAQAVNAWRVQILGAELFQEQMYEIAAAWTAHRQFEEASDAGTAYKFFPLKSVKIPRLETQYMTGTEEEAAVNAGITPVSVRNAEAKIPRSITSRSQTSLGAPDYTVLDTANVTVTDACADDIDADFQTRYLIKEGVAYKIMDDPTDGSRPPQFVVTPNLVIYDLWGWLDEWYSLLRIVNPDSPIDYKAQVAASRSGNRINAQCPIPVAGGAYIFDVALYQTAGYKE